MKAVILAGGLGTRLAEETDRIPKPMVSVGGHPILWHIMKSYERAGVRDFIICGGYKVQVIVEYFVNYRLHNSSIQVDLKDGGIRCLDNPKEDWRVTIVNTGDATMTGGRLKRIGHLLADGEPFCMTYGDGVIGADLGKIISFHKAQGCKATMTAVRPSARFGTLTLDGDRVAELLEKDPGVEEVFRSGAARVFRVKNPLDPRFH